MLLLSFCNNPMEKTWHSAYHPNNFNDIHFVIKIKKMLLLQNKKCTSSSSFLYFEYSLFLCNIGECVISIDTLLSSQYLNLSYLLLFKVARFNKIF